MNKRLVAITISSSLFLNSFQMALAAEFSGSLAQQPLSISEAAQLLGETNKEEIVALTKALAQVHSLSDRLKSLSTNHESNWKLRILNYLDLILVATSTYTLQAHMKKADSARILMSVNVAALVLKKISQTIKSGEKLDGKVVGQKIFETSQEISDIDGMPADILKIKTQLNELSARLLENKGIIENVAGHTDDADNAALGFSVIYLTLHLLYPKTAKEADVVIKKFLPQIQQSIAKITQVGKSKTATGATAATVGLPDLVRLAAGMTSEKSQDVVVRTLINLDSTAANIAAEIDLRSRQ